MELAQQLIADFGLWVVLVGTFLEGETIVIVAGDVTHDLGRLERALALMLHIVLSLLVLDAVRALYPELPRPHGRVCAKTREAARGTTGV